MPYRPKHQIEVAWTQRKKRWKHQGVQPQGDQIHHDRHDLPIVVPVVLERCCVWSANSTKILPDQCRYSFDKMVLLFQFYCCCYHLTNKKCTMLLHFDRVRCWTRVFRTMDQEHNVYLIHFTTSGTNEEDCLENWRARQRLQYSSFQNKIVAITTPKFWWISSEDFVYRWQRPFVPAGFYFYHFLETQGIRKLVSILNLAWPLKSLDFGAFEPFGLIGLLGSPTIIGPKDGVCSGKITPSERC